MTSTHVATVRRGRSPNPRAVLPWIARYHFRLLLVLAVLAGIGWGALV